jgi:hypothetical protein
MMQRFRRKAFNLPEDLAQWVNTYAFRSRGRMTQSQIATKALEAFQKENPLPPAND